jgi:WD repeat-containing protein 48
VLISEETKDSGAWAVKYRSMVSRTEEDIEPLEMAAPAWTLEYLFAGRGRFREPIKLCFLLEPWTGGDDTSRLPPMPAK